MLNLFCFFWTSFLYLPMFFFLNLTLIFNYYRNIGTLFSIILFSYSFETSDFLVLNLNSTNLDLNLSDINMLLNNNLNKYHPYIFYFSAILFFLGFTKLQYFITPKVNLFSSSFLISNFNNTIIQTLFINSLALFLGSYWALQEGTWGGWWNWDPSEVFGLLFFIFSAFFIHSKVRYNNIFKLSIRFILSSLIITLSYFLIQLNFDLVSHNFGTKFFYFFNNNLFLIEFSLFCTLFVVWTLLNFFGLLNDTSIILQRLSISRSAVPLNFTVVIIYIFVSLLAVFSFLPLFTYFLWYDVTTNYYSLVTYFNYIFLSFILLITAVYKVSNLNKLVLVIPLYFFNSDSFLPYLTFFTQWFGRTLNYIHILLSTFLLINFLSLSTDIIYFNTQSEFTSHFYHNQLLDNFNSYLSCNNFFIEYVSIYSNNSLSFYFDWNIFYISNSLIGKPSFLLFSSVGLTNIYSINSNWISTYSIIENCLLVNLYDNFLFLSLIIIFFFTYTVFKKIKY